MMEAPVRVVVVEDNPADAEMLRVALAQAGAHNFNNGHVTDGFGSRTVEYWTHD